MKGWKTIYQANGPNKQAGVAILISIKIGIHPKFTKQDKEGHIILMKDKIYQDELSIKIPMLQMQEQTHSLKKL